MKRIIVFLVTCCVTSFVNAQLDDWKAIPAPKLSTIDILYQNQKGEVLARTNPFIGLVKSLDGCQTWRFVDTLRQQYSIGTTIEKPNGDLLFYANYQIYKYNLSTNQISTLKTKGNLSQISFIGDETIIGYRENSLSIYVSDSLISDRYLFSNKIHKLLDANLPDKTYCIYVDNNKHHLYQIDKEGTLKKISNLNMNGKRYFYHNNTLIRDNQFSTDLGQTWTQYDLPFTEPDTIFKYDQMLAFGKDNKIYFKTNNATNFNVITLPDETNLANIYMGKFIITENTAFEKTDIKILRTNDGIFEAVGYDLANSYVNYFAAGFDEQIIASYDNKDAYFKKDSIQAWTLLPFKTRYYDPSFAFSEDRIIDVVDAENKIYSSFDGGQSWNKIKNQTSFKLSSIYPKKNAVFCVSPDSLYYRKTNETSWNSTKINLSNLTEIAGISNQAGLYSHYFGVELLSHLDTFGRIKSVRDIQNYRYTACTHYEMNTFYNVTISSFSLDDRSEGYQLSSSYDEGFTFNVLHDFPPSKDHISHFATTRSGHLVIVKGKSLLISGDEGQTWQEIKVDLNSRDNINGLSVSPDHYIYISTAEKGILKYKNPLAKPNIVYVSLSDDAQNDCEISNDEKPIIKQKVSLKNLSTQLTDAQGNAVFYSHADQNKLFIHNENDILDLCKDTVDLNFDDGGGHVRTEAFNGVTQQECAQLDVKLVNYSNSIYFQTSYFVLIKNNGNAVSNPSELHISMDPYQYLDTTINGSLFNKIAEGLYVVQISELAPSEEFMIQFYTNILPYVPFDRTICLSAEIIDHNNQCKPYENIVKCNQIFRAGKNKTIVIKYYEDTNGNCLKDPNEKYTIGHFNTINNNRDFFVDYDSIKYIITSLDTNNISFAYNDKLYAFCQETYPISMHKDSLYAEIEIPFRTLAYCTDLQLHGAHGTLRPCFERTVSYNLVNDGNINSGPITLSIQLDPELEVSHVFPAPFSVNGNNYVFKVNGLAVDSNQQFQFTVTVPCAASIGESYCFTADVMETIDPSLCQLQNTFTVENCLVSIGSYDPNDKTIFVSGIENKSNIQKDDEIEYRIRFQNTGTDTAYTVRLEDKLSDKFDIKSIKLTDYSHACTWKVENSILIVTFDGINLVDSFTNSLGSNGFITFKIKLKETIQINDEIRNKASIFFDFNDPIITNEVIKTFGTTVSTIDPKEQTQKSKTISFVPNPTSASFKVVLQSYDTPIIELSIFNISGQWVKTIRNHKPSEEIDARDLPSGAYIIKVQTSTATMYGKLIKI